MIVELFAISQLSQPIGASCSPPGDMGGACNWCTYCGIDCDKCLEDNGYSKKGDDCTDSDDIFDIYGDDVVEYDILPLEEQQFTIISSL